MLNAETRLKKTHIKLLRHPETCLYGGVILMGESSIEDDPAKCPTAYTDGINKRYGRKFVDKLTDEELAGLVLHENFHVTMKHLPRGRDLSKENARLANMAMDYAVNQLIVELANKDSKLCKLPNGGLYDPMFKDWSFRQIYDYLKKEMDKGGGGGGGRGEALDEHDMSNVEEMSTEEREQLSKDINEALQQSSILAGKLGAKIPRTIADLLQPKVDWREALREFVSASVRGQDDYTWQRLNKRRLMDEFYLPSVHSESVGELVVAIDTSGSIGSAEITEFATELVNICDTVTPEKIRVLWWDTQVHGEQTFVEDQYGSVKTLLKPMGGGGTLASCVSDYIVENNINAECVVVFTDGYLENPIKWQISSPTLWLVTRNRNLRVPTGTVVTVEK